MHRANLQKALLKNLPADILHLGKQAVSAQVDEHGATVFFEDHSSIKADIVIGADGIKSVREAPPFAICKITIYKTDLLARLENTRFIRSGSRIDRLGRCDLSYDFSLLVSRGCQRLTTRLDPLRRLLTRSTLYVLILTISNSKVRQHGSSVPESVSQAPQVYESAF